MSHLTSPLTSGSEMGIWNFPCWVSSPFGRIFLTVLLFFASRMVLYIFTGCYTKNISLSLRRVYRLLSSLEVVKDIGDFWSWTEIILHFDKVTNLWGPVKVKCGGLNENGPTGLYILSAWCPVNRIVWKELGSMALLEKVLFFFKIYLFILHIWVLYLHVHISAGKKRASDHII